MKMTKKKYSCEDCIRDIDAYFDDSGGEDLELVIERARGHMISGVKVICRKCWGHYKRRQKEYGGR